MKQDLFIKSEQRVLQALYRVGYRKIAGGTLTKLTIALYRYMEGDIGRSALRRKFRRYVNPHHLNGSANTPMFELAQE